MKFRNPAASPGALAPAALGLSILLYALGGMLSWIARARDFLPTAIGPTAVFGAAPCFALVGLAVALNRPDSRRMIAAQQALGAAVVLIAGLVAGPAWLDYGLGITWRGLDRWYDDNPYHPARMSLMTSTAFVVCGAVLALMHRVRNRGTGLMVQALTLAVAAVATAGLVGEALDLRFVYANYLFDRMAANTAAGLIVSSIALWLCWRWTSWHRQRTGSRNEGTRIRLAGAATVGATVAVSVIAGFNVAQREVEARVSDGLLRALNSRATLFRTDVEDRLVRAQLVAGRPDAASHL